MTPAEELTLAAYRLGHLVSWNQMPEEIAKPLAAWLRAEAGNDDPCHASTPDDCYVRRCSTHRALAVAREVIRATGGPDVPGMCAQCGNPLGDAMDSADHACPSKAGGS